MCIDISGLNIFWPGSAQDVLLAPYSGSLPVGLGDYMKFQGSDWVSCLQGKRSTHCTISLALVSLLRSLIKEIHYKMNIYNFLPQTPLSKSSKNSFTALHISFSVKSKRDTTLKSSCLNKLVSSYTSTKGALSFGCSWQFIFPIRRATLSFAVKTRRETQRRAQR